MTIKILLVDDQCLTLEGIKAVLQHESEIEVVGTARDGQSAIAQVKKLHPDIVLIDVEMPKMNGLVATKYICQYFPQTKVIVLTSHNNKEYLHQALQAGAAGYLLKSSLLEDLKQAICSLGQGALYIQSPMLNPPWNKIHTRNIIRYQTKITYVKKYRKSIYKPAPRKQTQPCLANKAKQNQVTEYGVSRANLAPIFDTSDYNNSPASLSLKQNLPVSSSSKLKHQRHLKRIIWLLIAIASFVLAIIIF